MITGKTKLAKLGEFHPCNAIQWFACQSNNFSVDASQQKENK